MSAANHSPKVKPRPYTLAPFAPSVFKESTSINALPVEIMTTIFKMIHADLVSEYSGEWEEVSDEQIASPTLFPYSISAVCRYWDGVISSFAEFWTRIVVWIDQPGHLERLKSSLDRSGSLELHSIWVVRSSEDNSLVDPLEKDKITDVLRALSGHGRPKSFVIRTLTTDSLPARVRTALNFHTLRLESRQRGLHAAPPNPLPLPNQTVDCSDLYFLSLTGPIFVSLWRNEKWRKALKSKGLESLTIAHLRAEDGGEDPFTFQELWNSFRTISSIEHLSWVNIDVPYIVNSASTPDFYDYDYMPASFTFDTVPANVLRAFYHRLQGLKRRYSTSQRVLLQKFHNCSFYGCPKYPSEFPFSDRIEVSGISSSDSLSLLFETADTNELLIRDCPGLDDASMSALGLFPFLRHEERTALPRMWSLEIQDFPNFSVRALREFVEFRKSSENEDWSWESQASGIGRLSLVGSCPQLSVEENEWFKENVDEFVNESFV